jgi:hypothetical protein
MRYLEDPRQYGLLDVFAEILSPVAYRRLTSGWQRLFRCAILKLMPAGKLAETRATFGGDSTRPRRSRGVC